MSDHPRTRLCGIAHVSAAGPSIEVKRGVETTSSWKGVLTCGHRWTCPVCASSIIAERRQQVLDALEAGRTEHPGATWRLLTLTLRHERGMPLRALIKGLLAAWRRTRQRGTVQRLWKQHVFASIRALEITEGEHGWHPHLHVLVLMDGWPTWEPSALIDTWQTMVARHVGVECTPSAERGVWWSSDVDGRYLAKLGLEITGTAKGNSAWGIAKQASQAYALSRDANLPDSLREISLRTADRLRAKWAEYESATKSVRAIELDDRAAAMAKRGEVIRIGAIKPIEDLKERKVTVISMVGWMRVLHSLEKKHPAILSEVLRVAERAPPDDAAATAAVHAWIASLAPARTVSLVSVFDGATMRHGLAKAMEHVA